MPLCSARLRTTLWLGCLPLQRLNLDWHGFRDERAQLQVLETALSGLETAPVVEITAPRLQGRVASNTPRLQGTALWLQGGAASNPPKMPGGTSQLQDRAKISTPKWQSAAPRLRNVAPGTPGLIETDPPRVRSMAAGTPGSALWTETAALKPLAPRPKSPWKQSKVKERSHTSAVECLDGPVAELPAPCLVIAPGFLPCPSASPSWMPSRVSL